MANFTQGIDPTETSTTQEFTLGLKVDDPRTFDYPGNKIRYVKAGSTITAGDALKVKTDETDEPWVLVPTAAVAETVVGIAHSAIASGSYGWVTVEGRVASANVGASISAGAKLGSSSTAGTLVALSQADSNFSSNNINAVIAQAAGVGLMALDANDSNAADIEVLIS